jgi:hypothetical protein
LAGMPKPTPTAVKAISQHLLKPTIQTLQKSY